MTDCARQTHHLGWPEALGEIIRVPNTLQGHCQILCAVHSIPQPCPRQRDRAPQPKDRVLADGASRERVGTQTAQPAPCTRTTKSPVRHCADHSRNPLGEDVRKARTHLDSYNPIDGISIPASSGQTLPWSTSSTVAFDYTLQQLAPYIGRMKTSMARSLVLRYAKEEDMVVDPFCGSGVVALEAVAAGRRVVAGDWNPYAVLLTQAKLFAPRSLMRAKTQLTTRWEASRAFVQDQDLRRVPRWVRAFFHPETLRNALAFRDACIEANDHFLLACLLGILHHERPGFLSYPSSHLVPYLRNQKYPKDVFPDMYKPRDVYCRMEAKVLRTYKRPIGTDLRKRRVFHGDARQFPRVRRIDAVITSPPYMNELDYVRDNRLRIWFLLGDLPTGLDLRHRNRTAAFKDLLGSVCGRLASTVRVGGVIVLVVGEATRGRGVPGHTCSATEELFNEHPHLRQFRLEHKLHDQIPDIRRSRRECRGTKQETILAFRKVER